MTTLKVALARVTSVTLRIAIVTALLFTVVPFKASAAEDLLDNRSDTIQNSEESAVTTHLFGFTMSVGAQQVGSILFEFCSNSPTISDPCTIPTGLDTTAATLAAQTGDTGFSIHPSSTNGRIILTRAPSNPLSAPSTYRFNTVTNPSDPGSHFVRLQTFGSTDATGPDIESGGVVFAIVPVLNVAAEVPPYIRFCAAVTVVSFDCSTATSFFIDFGTFSKSVNSTGSSQFVVATNANAGYSVTLSGTTLTSGNNVIPAMAAPTAPSPGTSQFGLNLRANTNPTVGQEVVGAGTSLPNANYGTPNLFKFTNGDVLVSSTTSNDNRKFTVSYVTNINGTQAPGVYATTISYICLANF